MDVILSFLHELTTGTIDAMPLIVCCGTILVVLVLVYLFINIVWARIHKQ